MIFFFKEKFWPAFSYRNDSSQNGNNNKKKHLSIIKMACITNRMKCNFLMIIQKDFILIDNSLKISSKQNAPTKDHSPLALLGELFP